MSIAHHPDMEGWYEAETTICQSCAATERERSESSAPEPGAKVYATNTRDMSKKPLPPLTES